MTDDETTDNRTTDNYPNLDPVAHARIDALRASSEVQRRSEGFLKASGPDVVDLIAVARFILGLDLNPWAPDADDGEQR